MILVDYCRQKLVDKLGGWSSATNCHFNVAVYRAKCQVIDTLSINELAKAKFKEGVTGIVPNSSNTAVPAQQATLSLDDIV